MRRNAMMCAGVLISAAMLTATGCNKAAKDTDDSNCPATCPNAAACPMPCPVACPGPANRGARRPNGSQPCNAIGAAPAAITAIDDQTRAALLEAMADERTVQNYYGAVMNKHGQRRPFSRVIEAERRHEEVMRELCRRYGVEIPAVVATSEIPVPETYRASCAKAAELERLNVAMYERFLGFIDEPDIRQAMIALRDASAQRHLPAFERNS